MARLNEIHHKDISHPVVKHYQWPGSALENFKNKLVGFDGAFQDFESREQAISWLEQNIDHSDKKVYSAISEFEGNVKPSEVTDPHHANIVDICVADGCYGVGESGSVWVTDKSLGEPACALFSTDLYLLLPKEKIVSSLQEAYEVINLGSTPYGSFYTGPSATADIEAVHITGAQGEISLTVLLY